MLTLLWLPALIGCAVAMLALLAIWLIPFDVSASKSISFGITLLVMLVALTASFLGASPLGVQIFGQIWSPSGDQYRIVLDGSVDTPVPDPDAVKYDNAVRQLHVVKTAPIGYKWAYREDGAVEGKFVPASRVAKIPDTVVEVQAYLVRNRDRAMSDTLRFDTKK